MSRYEYDSYMSSGESWERTARSRESSKDYLGAKDAYFSAAFEYDRAADIAYRDNDMSGYNAARSKSSSASSNASYMNVKYCEAAKAYGKERDY